MAAIQAGRRVVLAEARSFTADMIEARSAAALEHWEKIFLFLHEIYGFGGARRYAGNVLPYQCDHPGFENIEIFECFWSSPSMRRSMYLKFGIRASKTGKPIYIYLNCHEDQPDKRNH